jgi:hypothetical protein
VGVCDANLRMKSLLLLPLVVMLLLLLLLLWVVEQHVLGGLHMRGQLIRVL